jgi:pilus assembly protein CpaF
VTIRRFGATTLPLGAFCDPPVAELLVWAVHARLNTVVSGPTGAGKTTLLNALCRHLPAGERVVTVEDAAELRLPGDHVVRLETRPATPDGLAAVPVRELVRAALRMRPDRIVVGEVRGPETLDMLQAMNTGHDGSLSSCHANGPADALRRLETMALTSGDLPLAAVREQVAAAVDLVVHVSRGAHGHRRVTAVAEVADDPTAGDRMRLLAEADAVVRAPTRRPRRPDPPDAPSPSPSTASSGPAIPAAAAPPPTIHAPVAAPTQAAAPPPTAGAPVAAPTQAAVPPTVEAPTVLPKEVPTSTAEAPSAGPTGAAP